MVEVSLTVGKLDASLALLLTKDHHLIEFPTILLPNGVKAGSIVRIRCDRDLETEAEEQKKFKAIQDEVLATFGKNLPKAPVLKIKNVTQTSCVLEWDPLDLGTATLKSLTLYKDGKKVGAIPQPLTNRTTKLSGLSIDKPFSFQLRLDSTAGLYTSETIEVKTHKMTDLSGIHICLGDLSPNDQFTMDDIQEALQKMGAHHPALNTMRVETTHFVTTRENKQNPEFLKANEMNVPIIRPEWLKACERERRIVGVRDFYVKDCALPDIIAKNYWQKPANSPPPAPPKDSPESRDTPVSEKPESIEETMPAEDPTANATAESQSAELGVDIVDSPEVATQSLAPPTDIPVVELTAPSQESQVIETLANGSESSENKTPEEAHEAQSEKEEALTEDPEGGEALVEAQAEPEIVARDEDPIQSESVETDVPELTVEIDLGISAAPKETEKVSLNAEDLDLPVHADSTKEADDAVESAAAETKDSGPNEASQEEQNAEDRPSADIQIADKEAPVSMANEPEPVSAMEDVEL